MLTFLIIILALLPWAIVLACFFIGSLRWLSGELATKSTERTKGFLHCASAWKPKGSCAGHPSEITTLCMDCRAWISGPREPRNYLSHGLCPECAKVRLAELGALKLTPTDN